MNKEEKIEQFSEPPKNVKIDDVRVCILEIETDLGRLNSFFYVYPYFEEAGGMLKVFNPSYSDPDKYERIADFPNKLLMWQAYSRIKSKALRSNPRLKILYEGKILRDFYLWD